MSAAGEDDPGPFDDDASEDGDRDLGRSNGRPLSDAFSGLPRNSGLFPRVSVPLLPPSLIESWRSQLTGQLAAAITSFQTPTLDEAAQSALRHVAASTELHLAERLKPLFEKLVQQVKEALPSNWDGLPGDDVDGVISVVKDDGIPLTWVPRWSVVSEIANAAGPEDRRKVLLARQPEIVDDCIAALSNVVSPRLRELATYAAEAAASLRDSRYFSAQSAAAVVFDSLIHDFLDRGAAFLTEPFPGSRMNYRKFSTGIPPISDEATVREFRQNCALAPAVSALTPFHRTPGARPTVPTSFSRHASVHCACPEQNTPVNAIIGVMLVASLLREAEESGW